MNFFSTLVFIFSPTNQNVLEVFLYQYRELLFFLLTTAEYFEYGYVRIDFI